MNFNWLKNLAPMKRNLLGAGLMLVVLVVMANLVYLPKQQQIDALNTDLTQIRSEITIYQAKVKKLDTLLAENHQLKAQLATQRQQLPEQQEVANLLKQVTDLGANAGLTFRLWRPGGALPSESGLYQSLPVDVEVSGSYHQVGIFFEQVADLDRIVNISNVKINHDTAGPDLLSRFTATAFAAPSKAPVDPTAAQGGR